MNAAIKTLEDALTIRRLQLRELEREQDAARTDALSRDIAEIEAAILKLENDHG